MQHGRSIFVRKITQNSSSSKKHSFFSHSFLEYAHLIQLEDWQMRYFQISHFNKPSRGRPLLNFVSRGIFIKELFGGFSLLKSILLFQPFIQ